MTKHKSHSGMTKRIRISGSGRLLRQRAGRRHLLEHKPSTLTRHLAGTVEVHPKDAKRVRRLLGK
ncbi:MAG: 50S ribosomal protein L35 [Actinomycetota bacterium]|nr:50S ribosomal protein L35 [Actinomycetota bacterium]